MSIVLLEPSDASQSRQSSRQFIAVEDTEISHSQGKLPPRPRSVVKHQAIDGQQTVYKIKAIVAIYIKYIRALCVARYFKLLSVHKYARVCNYVCTYVSMYAVV